MIISASRRCDLPAFACDWLRAGLRRGWLDVAAPFRPGCVRRVALHREAVDAFVFWSRDVRPLLPHLNAWDRGGFPYVFLLTVNGYPSTLEPAAPPAAAAEEFFCELAARVGRRRLAWRYDPLLFTPLLDARFHLDNFRRLSERLAPHAFRVIVSFYDPYPRAEQRLRRAGIAARAGEPAQQAELLALLAAVSADAGLEIQSCAEPDLGAGVAAGACIDADWLNREFGLELAAGRDRGQRKLCRCQPSVDIGTYGRCRHGCLYCYAR